MKGESELECVADVNCLLGEAPLWHPEEDKLYWVDILAGTLLCYHPCSALHEQLYVGDMIGGIALQADGSLLLFQEEGAVRSWRNGIISTVLEPSQCQRGYRFNDVTVSPSGEVVCGVIPFEKAAKSRLAKYRRRLRRLTQRFQVRTPSLAGLYILDKSGRLTRLPVEVNFANGSGFSPDRMQFYLTDSMRREIHVFDCSAGVGCLADRRIFAVVPPDEGLPDGLTIDAEGYIWSARWGGGRVVRYDPYGAIERSIEVPARNVSSVTFGGPDYRHLYITTAGDDDRDALRNGAGALFRATPGIQGIPEFRSRIES